MKKFLFIILSLSTFYGPVLFGKTSQDLLRANYLYRQLAFHEAIPYYEKAAPLANDPVVFSELGDCYRYTKAMDQAAVWYKKAVVMRDCPAIVNLHYGQTLMTLQQYGEAAHWLEVYQKSVPDEKRVSNLLESCKTAEGLLSQVPSGTVSLLSFNTDGSDFGPTLRKGELIFSSDTLIRSADEGARKSVNEWSGHNYYNMYRVSCYGNGNCNNTIKKVADRVNTKFHDGPSVFSSDGKTMYFTRTHFNEQFLSRGSVPDPNGTVHLQIMVAKGYNDAAGTFESIDPFAYNSKKYSTAHPAISPSGKTLVFSSDMPGGKGGNDLYICVMGQDGKWGEPQNLSELNTEGDEMFPTLADDAHLYFASDGLVGLGGLDLYSATWDVGARTFSGVEHMSTPLNSSYDDMSLSLEEGGKRGYFASNRPAAKKGDNIYFINLQSLYLSLHILDNESSMPVRAATVLILGGKDKRNLTGGEDGHVVARLIPQGKYDVTVSKPGYQSTTFDVSTLDAQQRDTLNYEVRLQPEFNINYRVSVYDETTRQPLDDAMVVVSKLGGEDAADTVVVNMGESYNVVLDPDAEYNIYAVKDNYFGNEKLVSTKGITRTIGSVTLNDTIFMKELKVGEVYKIENIYYDFNKSNIREDAKPSLNQLLNLLDRYPQMVIQVNSHTDCRGSGAYNMKLSKDRAQSVIRYLHERGISESRLQFKGYGETKPISKCANCNDCTEAQHQQNRRTEFQIISM
jgi:outer membrane protein OmpA-like peptidoglycan-associated protein/Tol biopolymer transport system component